MRYRRLLISSMAQTTILDLFIIALGQAIELTMGQAYIQFGFEITLFNTTLMESTHHSLLQFI